MNQLLKNIQDTLTTLATGSDPLISQLSSSLAACIQAAGTPYPDSLSDPDFREVGEIISALVEKSLAREHSPSRVLEALIKIDGNLMREAQIRQPIAGQFVPLASERALQAAAVRQTELAAAELAERSPIFRIDKRTLCVAPVGPLSDEGLNRFVDRILARATRERPKKVLLVQSGLAPSPSWTKYFSLLKDELASMKTRLEKLD